MRIPIIERTLLDWLRSQWLVMNAWSSELSCQDDTDLETLERLQKHKEWLSGEIERFENNKQLAA